MQSRAQTKTSLQAAVWAKKRKEQVERAQKLRCAAGRACTPCGAILSPAHHARRDERIAREQGRMSTGSSIASEDFVNVGLPPTPPPTEPPAARRLPVGATETNASDSTARR